ncbi:MAG: DUF547 domain-containing protein [Nitrospira sp.]|nr:DUF547 domain-containing protein [Nitrospira sp.]MBH0183224.1 DUF547 domain-containing protein [Nitrospira sp.]MBH0186090.1 DUF547 domain-containing protein [Nitrospira sp.]
MKFWMGIGLLLILTSCSSVPGSFSPTNPIPAMKFSHALLGAVLSAHVNDGVVDYPAIQTDDRQESYLRQLDRVDPNAFVTRNEQLAFWINAYNAFAIKGIVDGYSPVSYIGRYRYFIGRAYQVGGGTITLYDLERQVLIQQFHEPLIHFAIVCASSSCPRLQPWAYQPSELDRQLDYAARAFVNDPTRNRFDRKRKVASLSKIFDWFAEDFSAAAGSTLAYVARYVGDPALARELVESGYRIEFLEYDWSLNGIPPKEVARDGAP